MAVFFASIITNIIQWLLTKLFGIIGKNFEEWQQEREAEKAAKAAVKTYEEDKAKATTKEESARAGQNMLNS